MITTRNEAKTRGAMLRDEWIANVQVGWKGLHYQGGLVPTQTVVTKITKTQIVTTTGRFHRLGGINYQPGDAHNGAGYLSVDRDDDTSLEISADMQTD